MTDSCFSASSQPVNATTMLKSMMGILSSHHRWVNSVVIIVLLLSSLHHKWSWYSLYLTSPSTRKVLDLSTTQKVSITQFGNWYWEFVPSFNFFIFLFSIKCFHHAPSFSGSWYIFSFVIIFVLFFVVFFFFFVVFFFFFFVASSSFSIVLLLFYDILYPVNATYMFAKVCHFYTKFEQRREYPAAIFK